MNILAVSLLLGLVVMEAWSKPVFPPSITGPSPTVGLMDLIPDKLPGEDDEDSLPTDALPKTGNSTAGKRLLVGFKLRLLRILFRLIMLKMSKENLEQTGNDTVTSSEESAMFGPCDGLSGEELCACLCRIGSCPPGCKGNLEPPWGGRRR